MRFIARFFVFCVDNAVKSGICIYCIDFGYKKMNDEEE